MSVRAGVLATLALGALVSLAGLIAGSRLASDDAVAAPSLVPALMLGLLAAVLATRGRGRVVIGALMAVLTAALGVDAVTALMRQPAPQDPLAVAAVLTLGLGAPATSIAVAVLGRHWPGLGGRYERTGAIRSADSARSDDPSALQMWRDLDAGVDPTDR